MALNPDPIQMLQLLTRVSLAFSEPIDRKALVSRILHYATELGNGERGTLFLVSDKSRENGAIKSLTVTGLGDQETQVDDSRGIAGHVYRSQQSVVINDAQNDPRFDRGIDQATGNMTK